MTLRVGITGVGGDVARGAALGLRRNPPDAEPIHVVGFGTGDLAAETRHLDSFVRLPPVASGDYVEALLAALQANDIDVLLPGIDSEIVVLSDARARFIAAPTAIVLAPEELVDAADDKLATARFLAVRGIGAPQTRDALSGEGLGFPLIAKPRRGHGSRGVVVVPDAAALQRFLGTRPQNYCLQVLVDGPEITVGFLYDSRGRMCDAIAMERTLQDGRTATARVVADPDIVRFMEEFGAKVPGIGAINAQLRWHRNEGPRVFEINARLSGSTEMRVAVGFNDPLRLARHFGRGEPIVRARPSRATVRRDRAGLSIEPC